MSWIRGSRARSAFKETTQTPIRAVACAAAHHANPSHRLHSSFAAVEGEQPLSIYLHLPFCKRKCFYCDFPVHAVGTKPLENSRRLGIIRDYVDLLISEIGSTLVCNQEPLKTVFFGGGTPSLTPPTEVERILEAVDHRFGIASDVEMSLEADPGTFDVRRLREYISLGVTRFSMGVQAFDDQLLKTSGRSHDLADVRAAVRAMHAAGPSSWSLDLISGLPGLTVRSWENSLREAISASPDHVSIYDLQVEDGTPFARWVDQGRLELPQEDSATEMFRMASQLLREEGGFEHYEISNYALPGHRCQHNMAYWTLQPFYAMGVGAASFVDGVRSTRPRTMGGYRRWVEETCGHADTARSGGSAHAPAGQLPAVPPEPESLEDRLLNEVMLRLRLKDGLSVVGLRQRYGRAAAKKVVEALGSWKARGLVLETCDGLRLADPDGWLVSNSILSDVFLAVMDTGDKQEAAC